jgi:tetratricopeptide (TPR) repeat protein
MRGIKYFLPALFLFIASLSPAQTTMSSDQIRQRMAEIRKTTNWDDPAAAEKANAEIRKLAGQLGGAQPAMSFNKTTAPAENAASPGTFTVRPNEITTANIVAIADRFYNRSYKALGASGRTRFDQHLKEAMAEEFSLQAVRKLAGTGGILLSIGDDHNLACVYLASAVKAMPDDTLSVNNFGAYLRIIDSVKTSVPVLLHADKLYGESPIILTQLGCSYLELGYQKEAEGYLREALEYNSGFGQAHTALCELYIRQNRLEDALLELFAGVKGMGASYSRASANYNYLQQQAEKAGEKGNQSAKEAFWDETRNQIKPEDALAPLVPSVDRLKMPAFPSCQKVADWTEGGGYASAVGAYNRLINMLRKFAGDFQQVQKEVPALPPNAVLRDYPNERFALDCITEYFFRESKNESDDFEDSFDEIIDEVAAEADAYFQNREQYTNEMVRCAEGCGSEGYCIMECHRVYCTKECPAANIFNNKLQSHWEASLSRSRESIDNQKKILDDLYEFSAQWFGKIESPYWSRIYAYEIQRVALSVIANAYAAYARPFQAPVHNDCGTDCSAFANPYPVPAEEVEEKEPDGNECPEDKKLSFGLAMCSIALDCESAEFGCSEVVAFSIKRNFKNKSTTSFLGVGTEKNLGFARAEATAGVTMTRYDNGDLDFGVKAEVSVTGGVGPGAAGKNYEVNVTVMEGLKTDNKDLISF